MVTKAINALEKQGVTSHNTDGECCYRRDGKASSEIKCIVGHMFSDKYYVQSLESQGAGEIHVKNAIYRTLYTKKELEKQTHEFDEQQEVVILLLQRIHDCIKVFDAEDFHRGIARMREMLEKYSNGRI